MIVGIKLQRSYRDDNIQKSMKNNDDTVMFTNKLNIQMRYNSSRCNKNK